MLVLSLLGIPSLARAGRLDSRTSSVLFIALLGCTLEFLFHVPLRRWCGLVNDPGCRVGDGAVGCVLSHDGVLSL